MFWGRVSDGGGGTRGGVRGVREAWNSDFGHISQMAFLALPPDHVIRRTKDGKRGFSTWGTLRLPATSVSV